MGGLAFGALHGATQRAIKCMTTPTKLSLNQVAVVGTHVSQTWGPRFFTFLIGCIGRGIPIGPCNTHPFTYSIVYLPRGATLMLLLSTL